ncbi:MAG: hypothetical protein B6U86_01145 [Candidatus Altiarchaeales archaeon ex4484_43]|nr:MAG: hypothetical protein B6U86_01145 [Candidatus Altiarchaeales archaeon ex4484_43]
MDDFELLKRKIMRARGFNCNCYKESSLKRRIRIRMNANNIHSYSEYIKFLTGNEEEYDKLIDTLTVNVTEFFRDPETYDKINVIVLPELTSRKRKEGRKIIRIWCAGCASGEEPYSIAILLREYLGDKIDDFIIFIRATDIDEKSLELARKGEYKSDVLKNMKKYFIRKYFERINDSYRIKDSIRNMVRFEKHDIISGKAQRYFDMILCRNVLIYLSRDTQRDIFEMFHRALNNKGYLIIGKTETMHEQMANKFELIDLSERIYRKIS